MRMLKSALSRNIQESEKKPGSSPDLDLHQNRIYFLLTQVPPPSFTEIHRVVFVFTNKQMDKGESIISV